MLATGQTVKDFTLQDKNGKSISLSDFKGQRVVVYFYPKDDTPGCTKQACAFRDAYAGFHERKIPVIGISRDNARSHQKFAEKYNLPFLLLADPDGTVIDAFGVKSAFGAVRATFVISELGLVEKVFEKANPDTNAADILEYLERSDKMELKNAIKGRRSFYNISKTSTLSDEKIVELVTFATKHTPSAFNNQSQMTAILLGANHDKLWDIVLEALRKVVPTGDFAKTTLKIEGFKAGYGTVLYFNDDSITTVMQESNPFYADNFPVWAEQANGMLQFAIWSLLENEGLGASLQHYNPLINDAVQASFDIPKSWRLLAQMPFGVPAAQPAPKEFADTTTRVKILK